MPPGNTVLSWESGQEATGFKHTVRVYSVRSTTRNYERNLLLGLYVYRYSDCLHAYISSPMAHLCAGGGGGVLEIPIRAAGPS